MPLAVPTERDDVLGPAGVDAAPDQGGAGARVDPAAEGGRDLGDDLGQGEGEVLRQVGT